MSHLIKVPEDLLVLLCVQNDSGGLRLCWYTEELTLLLSKYLGIQKVKNAL